MTYYAVYASLLLAVLIKPSEQDARTTLYWAVLFALILFSGLRWEVGCDWSNYSRHFELGEFLDYEEYIELSNPSHWILISLLHRFGLSYLWLNVAYSIIFFVGLHALARRQPNPLAVLVLCFPILILNMPMAAIRQAAAIGFMCLAYVAFLDRRTIIYAAWILFGSTFHSSILLFLLLTPFVLGEFNRRNAIIGALLAAPVAYVLLQTQAADVAENRYIGTDMEAAGAEFRLGILLLSGVFFLVALAPTWRRQFPSDYKLAAIGAWMMVAFFSLILLSSVIGDRFGYYLIPLQAMIFARIPYLHLGQARWIYSILPYAALSVLFIVWTQLSRHFNQCYLPYQFGVG